METDSGSNQNDSFKRNSLELLSREDVVKKCKHFLQLAQKAKSSKDEFATENRYLKDQLVKYEIQKEEDKNSILRMKEIIENFNKKDDTNTHIYNEQMEQLYIEKESLQRQVNRLSKENDELLSIVDKVQMVDFQTFKDLQEKCEKYQLENSQQSNKIKRITLRLLEVSKKISKLRESKATLLNIQNEYASSITKWQSDIMKASNLLYTHIEQIEKDKNQLENKFSSSTISICQNIRPMIELCDRAILEVDVYKREFEILHRDKLVYGEKHSNLEKLDDHDINITIHEKEIELPKDNIQDVENEQKNYNKHFLNLSENLSFYNFLPSLISLCNKALIEYTAFEKEIEYFKAKNSEDASKQIYFQNSDLLSEMRELNEILKERGDVISRQKEKIQELEKKNIDMEKEMEEHKNIDNSAVLSTSTISRIEEITCLKEVDESLGERYDKLRNLASKLKKKCQYQAEVLSKMDIEKTSKNVQALQKENDMLQDEVEFLKKNQNLNGHLVFQKEKENFIVIKQQIERERDMLKSELDSKINEIDMLKTDIQTLKAVKNQSNVLGLEVEAYAKSLNKVSEELSEKNSLIEILKNRVESKTKKILNLNKEIQLIEENLATEKNHSQELMHQIDYQLNKIKVLEQDTNEINRKAINLESEYNKLKAENYDLTLSISEVDIQNQKLCSSLNKDKEQLVEQVVTLEDTIKSLKNNITTSKKKIEDLEVEFATYKLKAKNVLQINQSKESSRERELEDELAEIRTEKDILNIQIQTLTEKLNSSDSKILKLTMDSENVEQKCKVLMDLIEECREQNTCLLIENKEKSKCYKESLRSHMLQIDTLNIFYKSQMEELENKYQTDLIFAKENLKVDTSHDALLCSNQLSVKSLNAEKDDLLLTKREDAEGSESKFTSVPKRKTSQIQSRFKHIIPFDELLNSDIDFNDSNNTEGDDDLTFLKNKIFSLENQLTHLTSLLAETEQDLAKLFQQNSLLKEELRRNERAEEREKHMHNSEYLKNVVVKFITLSNGDERSRLVPVLNTILKLSKEENVAIENVAKGKGLDSGNRSWGNLLWKNN